MKDFIKWLGVNEKIAKVAVWLLIFMIFLIIINIFLESLGFPYYKITVENLSRINLSKLNLGKVLEYAISCLINILNYYATIMLVVRTKDFKKTIKYTLIYFILNMLIVNATNYAICQIFIFTYILGYLFLYGDKNWKYILYGLVSILINTGIQYVCYLYKIRFIEIDSLSALNTLVTSLDYFIVMTFIIIVKEIYLKRRSKKSEVIQC